MISYLPISVLLCTTLASVFGNFNASNYETNIQLSNPTQTQGRQLHKDSTGYENAYPSVNGNSYIVRYGNGRSLHTRRPKNRREENSPQMPDFEEEHPVVMEKPLMYNYDFNLYRPVEISPPHPPMPHSGYYYGDPYSSYQHLRHQHMKDLVEGKTALTAFGIGLLIGLGLLGLLSGALKFLLGPIALGTLLSLLLVLAAPVPVITTGRKFLESLRKKKLPRKLDLEEKLKEASRKLTDLNTVPGSNGKASAT